MNDSPPGLDDGGAATGLPVAAPRLHGAPRPRGDQFGIGMGWGALPAGIMT